MNRFLVFSLVAVLISGCSHKDERPPQASDSLLVKPMAPDTTIVPMPADDKTGLYIDRSRLRTPEHEKLLARFTPDNVVDIYHNFKPLRKKDITEEQLNAYLKEKKITFDELKAVLEEGDRLGWAKGQ
ncbi:MAG TPA: hypothetical protein VEW28_09860 [Candidatus Kapabacteria bacterium]|nr:hypothetical protein [Candidatus Kapabacteria bacterium]